MHRIIAVEPYPFGKRFGLTMVDDTDRARLREIEPVYSCLEQHGLRTTKTVWPLEATALSNGRDLSPGQTLQDPAYRAFCLRLQSAGFEIAMHTATGGDSKRDETIRAYRFFEETFGHPPITNVMHGRNRENLYWGPACTRFRAIGALVGRLAPYPFEGHDPRSEYYWGDLCRERTRYVRLFETNRLDTLAFDPATPYHDPRKPDVPWWFSATYAAETRLLELVTASGLDRMAERRGASILHVYLRRFAVRSAEGGHPVHPGFLGVVRLLASRSDGWYVPVATLLDRLRSVRQVAIESRGGEIVVRNLGALAVADLALRMPHDVVLVAEDGNPPLVRNEHGQVLLGTLLPGMERRLRATARVAVRAVPRPEPDEVALLAGHASRIAWQFLQGRRRKRLLRLRRWRVTHAAPVLFPLSAML